MLCLTIFVKRMAKECHSIHMVWEPHLSTASTDLCICTTLSYPAHSISLALLSTKFHSSQSCGPYLSLIGIVLAIEYWQIAPVLLQVALREALTRACHHPKLLSLIYKLWKRNHFHYLLCQSKWINKTLQSSYPAWLPNYSPHSVACHSLSCDIFPFPQSYILHPL